MLFDEATDRLESTNLFVSDPGRAATLLALNRRFLWRLPAAFEAPIVDTANKEKMRDALRALGYIE